MFRLRYLIYAVLAVIALAGLSEDWLASGATGPREVQLHIIATNPLSHQHQQVITTGVVRYIPEGRQPHVVLEVTEDPNLGRVLLVGVEAGPFVDHVVEVTGTVAFSEDRGTSLAVDEIRDLGPAP